MIYEGYYAFLSDRKGAPIDYFGGLVDMVEVYLEADSSPYASYNYSQSAKPHPSQTFYLLSSVYPSQSSLASYLPKLYPSG